MRFNTDSARPESISSDTANQNAIEGELTSPRIDLQQARLSLFGLGIGSFALLTMLILFSGDKAVLAYTDTELMAVENSTVNAQSILIQPAYSKQHKVYGLVESAQKAELGFELSGLITQVLVTEGQKVSEGQPLASLDTQRLVAQQKELDAALRRAKADANLAALSAKRSAELVEKRLEPIQRLDEASAALEAATALVNEVKARQQSLAVELKKSQLFAPFNGQVVRQYLDAGTVVNPGQALFSLLGEGNLEARIGLPSESPMALKLGDSYSLNFKQNRVPSTLISIANQRNQATRSVDALFAIDAKAAEQYYLMPGDLLSLSVDVEIDKQGAWVPVSAISNGVRGLWTLFVVDKSTDEQIIQARSVTVEYMEGERAFVSGAIAQGDLVVVSGLHRLTPNQTVHNVQVTDTTSS